MNCANGCGAGGGNSARSILPSARTRSSAKSRSAFFLMPKMREYAASSRMGSLLIAGTLSHVDLQSPRHQLAGVLAGEVDDLELPVALGVLALERAQVVDGAQIVAVGAD